MCCSITHLIGRSGHGCGICCPGSGFLGPQSSGATVAAVHSFAVQSGTTDRFHAYPLA